MILISYICIYMKQKLRERGPEFESKQGFYNGKHGGKERRKFCNCIITSKKEECEIALPYFSSISTFYRIQKRNGSWKMTMRSHKPNQGRIIIEAAFSDLFLVLSELKATSGMQLLSDKYLPPLLLTAACFHLVRTAVSLLFSSASVS